MPQMSIKIEGLDAALRKLDPALLRGPKLKFLTDAALKTLREEKIRSPIETGRLRSSLRHRVDSGLTPNWASVGTSVVPYPKILDESARHHYRRSQFAGEPTKGWFSDVPQMLRAQYERLIREFAKRVESLWTRTK